jgi:hypothetical protein
MISDFCPIKMDMLTGLETVYLIINAKFVPDLSTYTPEEMKPLAIDNTFNELDQDKDGFIDKSDIAELVGDDAEKIAKKFNDPISKEEFCTKAADLVKPQDDEEQFDKIKGLSAKDALPLIVDTNPLKQPEFGELLENFDPQEKKFDECKNDEGLLDKLGFKAFIGEDLPESDLEKLYDIANSVNPELEGVGKEEAG